MTLRDLHDEITEHLDAIRLLFRLPDETKITLVVRSPHLRDGDVIETNDDLALVIQAIERMKERPPTFEPAQLPSEPR